MAHIIIITTYIHVNVRRSETNVAASPNNYRFLLLTEHLQHVSTVKHGAVKPRPHWRL